MRNFGFFFLSLALALLATGCNKPSAPQAEQPAAQQAANGAPPAGANGLTPPRLTKRVHAEFPQKLWDKQGTVNVAVLIKADGSVGDAKVMYSPHPELNPYALNAVKQWQFDPAKKDGKPVPITVTVAVQFQKPGANSAAAPQK